MIWPIAEGNSGGCWQMGENWELVGPMDLHIICCWECCGCHTSNAVEPIPRPIRIGLPSQYGLNGDLKSQFRSPRRRMMNFSVPWDLRRDYYVSHVVFCRRRGIDAFHITLYSTRSAICILAAGGSCLVDPKFPCDSLHFPFLPRA